ncbi:zinc finger CCHC-type and RNA-binding motif-containing protein 1-like, partial [Cajanus cajan]|uniref:zinc finger CCHC-type and RNA-binding motif-containing protein 1-like n=1 Tax=Cajanus cajan TaxID=3821 RepID=UPI00098D811A
MTQGETTMDLQKRFTHIINHIKGLGKIFDEDEVNVKVLKSLNRRWQPTVTTIIKSKNLAKMKSVELFGNLREYEMDMTRMAEEEQNDKKVKGLALNIENSSSQEECSSKEEESKKEELNLMVRKFWRIMKKNFKNKPSSQKKFFKKNDNSSPKFKCFECGKAGQIKADCPNLRTQGNEENKSKFRSKKKKAYIAWEDNASITSSNNEQDYE